MLYFKRTCWFALVSLGLMAGLPAQAAGTDAGTPINNSVTLDYTVNGGNQPQAVAGVSFLVDRALAVDVTTADGGWVSVTIGQQATGQTGVPALNFQVQNASNDAIDIVMAVVGQGNTQVSGFNPVGGSTFVETGLIVALDDDGSDNRAFDDGADTELTAVGGVYTLSNVAKDQVYNVMVVLDVPPGAAASDYSAYTLVAAVAEAGTGTPIAIDASGNGQPDSGVATANLPDDPNVEQDVFADAGSPDSEDEQYDFFAGGSNPVGPIGGSQDAGSDGQSSDTSGVVVVGVGMQVAKYVEVLYDPISDNRYTGAGVPVAPAVEPKAIPGAVVMYVIGVRNSDTVFTVDGVTVTDDIPDGVLVTDTEPVQEGNQSGAVVNVPASVTFDLAGTPATFNTAPIADLDGVYSLTCAGLGSAGAYTGTTVVGGNDTAIGVSEVDVSLGQCGPADEAFVAYFVTVETAN